MVMLVCKLNNYFLLLYYITTISTSWGIMNTGSYRLPTEGPTVKTTSLLQRSDPDLTYQPERLQNTFPEPGHTTAVQVPLPGDGSYGHLVTPADTIKGTTEEPSNIQIEMSSINNNNYSNIAGKQAIYFVVKNLGKEDEYIHINVSDKHGYVQEVPLKEFYLASGTTREISVLMNYPPDAHHETPDIITVNASGKRSTVKRSAYYNPWNDYSQGQYQQQAFCYERYVTGNCRYRTDPYDCANYKWTAYATIQNQGGYYHLRSIPEGLVVPPESSIPRDGLRVYLTVTCCIPIVQFLSIHPNYPSSGSACIVDVRELQGLNAAEIAGIVIGVIILLIIIIVIIALIIRRRRQRTILVGQPVKTTRETVPRE